MKDKIRRKEIKGANKNKRGRDKKMKRERESTLERKRMKETKLNENEQIFGFIILDGN